MKAGEGVEAVEDEERLSRHSPGDGTDLSPGEGDVFIHGVQQALAA